MLIVYFTYVTLVQLTVAFPISTVLKNSRSMCHIHQKAFTKFIECATGLHKVTEIFKVTKIYVVFSTRCFRPWCMTWIDHQGVTLELLVAKQPG